LDKEQNRSSDNDGDTRAKFPAIDSYLQSTTALIANPSVALWAAELLYLADGQRDGQLEVVGHASEYIRSLWAESDDHIYSEASFRQALEEFVIQWNPSISEDPARLDIILSLIQAFWPLSGFGKIAGHLKTSNWFGKMYSPPISRGEPYDLHLKALKVLETYFKTAPLQSTPSYQTYVHILTTQLNYDAYRGYALARLLDLEEKTWNDPQVLEYIEHMPESLTEIIPVVLQGHLLSVAGEALGAFYAQSIAAETTHVFEEIVRQHGWEILPESREIVEEGHRRIIEMPNPLIFKNGTKISLNLPASGVIEFADDESPFFEPEWFKNPTLYETQIADVVQLLITQSIRRLEGTPISWEELTKDLNPFGIEIRVDRIEDQLLAHFSSSDVQTPLKFPKPTLEILLLAYTSAEPPEIKDTLHAAATGGSS